MSTISPHTTRANGTVLTATIYNADHANHVSNAQNLNNDKIEGATPPVVDGALVLFDGTGGAALRDSAFSESDLNDFGDLSGPAVAVNENFTRFDGTTGKLVEDSGFSIPTTAEVRSSAANRLFPTSQIESASAPVTLTDAATIAVDWDTFINGIVTLGGNRTFGNPTNVQIGTWRTVEIVQDGTGNRTLTFDTNYVKNGGTEPDLTNAASAHDRIALYAQSATRIEVYVMALDIKA